MNYKKFQKKKFCFLFFSLESCTVCISIIKQVERLAEKYPEAEFVYIDLEKHEDAKGYFSIFTVPVLLVYSDQKELIREVRFFHFEEIEKKLDKYYNLIFKD